MQSPEREVVARFCHERLFGNRRIGQSEPQPTYKEALAAWAIRWKTISFSELDRLTYTEVDWWVRKSILREFDLTFFGAASLASYINACIRYPETELARVAAAIMVEKSIALKRPYGDVSPAAKLGLKTFGLIKSVGRPPSLINTVLDYVLKRTPTTYDWKKLFATRHRHAERIAALVKQKFEVDIDACIVRLDSLCDLVMEELVARICPGIGYKYGSTLNSPSKPLLTSIPTVVAGFKALHDMRISSVTAHPRSMKTGTPTRRLKHSDYRKIRLGLVQSFDEIEKQITP